MKTLPIVRSELREIAVSRKGVMMLATQQRAKFEGWLKFELALKSAFLACQLHHLIRRRSLITEMFQYETPQIMLPDLSPQHQASIVNQAAKRLEAEEQYLTASKVNRGY